jgi:hypothetical protein
MKSLKTRTVFFSIAILAVLIIIFGLYWAGSRAVNIQLKSDKDSYFRVDKPVVELSVSNLRDANNGQITVMYDNSILDLTETNTSEGVTYDTLGNSVIFELSRDFINSEENKAAEMIFDSEAQGTVEMGFDEAKTIINNDEGEMEISLNDVYFEIGVAPRESTENEGETTGTDNPNEI